MLKFLKSAFFTGLYILLPLLFLFLVLKELIELLVVVATPIADLFPEDTFDTENETEILAALLIIGTALVLGLLAKIPPTRDAGRYIAARTVDHLPFYRMLRTLVSAFLDMEESKSFKPALIHQESGDIEPVYIIEDTGRPRIVVLFPWSPTAFSGSIKAVPRERVEELSLTLDEFSLVISNYGIGLADAADLGREKT